MATLAVRRRMRSPLREWHGKFLNYLRLTGSESTAERYDRALETIFKHFRNKYSPSDFLRPDVEDYKIMRKREGVGARTINLELSAGHSLYEFMIRMGEPVINPFARVQKFKQAETRKKALSLATVEKIMAAADTPQDKMLALLAFTTGLRGDEMVRVEKAHFDLESEVLNLPAEIVKGKKKGRTVPLREDLIALLKDWPEGRIFEGWVKTQDDIYYRWRRLLWKAEVPAIGLHATRHTYATQMLRAGADIATVRDLLGHSSVKTTGTYLTGAEAKEAKKFLTVIPSLGDNKNG